MLPRNRESCETPMGPACFDLHDGEKANWDGRFGILDNVHRRWLAILIRRSMIRPILNDSKTCG